MTSQNVASAHHMFPLGHYMLHVQSPNELLLLTTGQFALADPFLAKAAVNKISLPLKAILFHVRPRYLK